MVSRIFAVIALFVSLLLYFVFGTGWYAPARLTIQGTAPAMQADLEVRWDSGSGFNSYESERFPLNTVAADETGMHRITIRALGEKDPGSLSTAVEIHAVYLDGRKFDLAKIRRQTILRDRMGFHLTKKGESIQFTARARKHIRLELTTSYYFGKVAITVDGVTTIHDLYAAGTITETRSFDYWVLDPGGRFTVAMDMPRYAVKRLVIVNRSAGRPVFLSSVTLKSARGVKSFKVNRNEPLSRVSFTDMNKDLKRYLDPSQFLLEVGFAALTTWMLIACFQFWQRSGGLAGVFTASGRPLFWLFFLGAVAVYSVWLAAFWPGVMSVDSLKIWRAAMLPGVFTNGHPVLNYVFYMYLMHIWNNVAVVPIAQILLVSWLVAAFFFALRRRGVSLVLLVPCYLLVVCSIPVGLYNVILWKDIPFALLVVFWGLALVYLYNQRRAGQLHLSWPAKAALFLLYLAPVMFRYNGIVYLAVIPVYIMALRLVSLKKVLAFIVVCTLAAGGLLLTMHRPGRMLRSQFIYHNSLGYLQEITRTPLDRQLVRTAGEYFDIFDMNKKGTVSDRWHYYLHDRFAYGFLRSVGFNDVYPYVKQEAPFPRLRKAAMRLYWKTYEKPWYYLVWDPLYMLPLIPLFMLLFRRFPNTALYSSFLFFGAIVLVFPRIFNWRYYYFFYFGLYFVLPLAFLDLKLRRNMKTLG